MNIIALIGWKGSGKDTVANYLVNKYEFYHLKFAKYIKNAANVLFPNIPFNEIENKYIDEYQEFDYWEIDKDTPRAELNGYTKRDVLVDLAKHLKSLYGEDIFVKNLNRDLEYLSKFNSSFVISDLRFKVEFDYLKQLNQNKEYEVSIFEIKNRCNYYTSDEIYTDYLEIRRQLDLGYDGLNYDVILNDSSKEDLYKLVDSKLEY